MSVLQNDVHSTSKYVKILMDNSASILIIHDSFVFTNKLYTKRTTAIFWSLMAGSFLMSCKSEVGIKLPEFKVKAHIYASFHVVSQKSNYNVILWPKLSIEP